MVYGSGDKTGQDRTGQDRTGLEKGLDNTIPEAWRSSQLIASHGPWPIGDVDKAGQDRTGKWAGLYNT
jgi:hypothetical protein